jgi:hypothetical protein
LSDLVGDRGGDAGVGAQEQVVVVEVEFAGPGVVGTCDVERVEEERAGGSAVGADDGRLCGCERACATDRRRPTLKSKVEP